MSWVNGFYSWLFGVRPQRGVQSSIADEMPASELIDRTPAPTKAAAGVRQAEVHRSADETMYEESTDASVGHAKQHQWLFEEGVLHWNQRRRDQKFKPYFAGVNFLRTAAKTRLWGCPADLAGSDRVVLSGIDLQFADMQGCTLTRADLRHANLRGANFRNANLASANFESADLTDCDLRGAVLEGADFSRARLVSANLSGASVKDANFAWADVSHMIATSQKLRETNLFGVNRSEFPAEVVARV